MAWPYLGRFDRPPVYKYGHLPPGRPMAVSALGLAASLAPIIIAIIFFRLLDGAPPTVFLFCPGSGAAWIFICVCPCEILRISRDGWDLSNA